MRLLQHVRLTPLYTRVSSLSNRQRHILAVLALTALILTAFPSWLLPGQLGLDDLSHLNAPQRMLLSWFYLHRHWPLWNPYSFAGQPFLAAGQSGPLYLPNLVFLFMPISPAMKLSYALHEWLAAFGMYLAVWHLGKRHLAALSAAIAFSTSGFLVGHLIHTQMFDAMTWLPLLFWLEIRLFSQTSVRNAAYLAAAFALEIYAGHPQITFFVLLTLSMYALLHGLQNPHRTAWKGILYAAGGIVLGVLLAAAQWLPTLNLVSYSDRSDVSSSFLLNGSWPWSALVQFLTPFPAGGGYTGQPFSISLYNTLFHTDLYWEYTAYTGLLSIVLGAAVVARDFVRSQAVRNALVIGLAAIVLALGSTVGIGPFLAHTPGFNLFRIPARYVGIADFCFSLLFGLALASMQNNWAKKRLTKTLGFSGLFFLCLLLLGVMIGPLKYSPPAAVLVPAAILTFVILLSLFSKFLPARVIIYSIACIAMADSVFQASFMSRLTLVPQATYTHPSGAVKFLQKHLPHLAPFTRVAALSLQSSLSLDMSLPYQIPALNGYDSLVPLWYNQAVNLTWGPQVLLSQPRSLLDELGVKYVAASSAGSPLLPTKTIGIQAFHAYVPSLPKGHVDLKIRVASVSQSPGTESVASYTPLVSVTLQSGANAITYDLSGSGPTEFMIPIPASWPRNSETSILVQNQSWTRLTMIPNLWLSDTHNSHFNEVRVGQVFGPKAFSLVYKSSTETLWKNPDATNAAWVSPNTTAALVHSGHATLQAWAPNQQAWQVQSADGGTFVLSQMYDPNWHALVDGKPVPVKEVNQVLTGVQIPPGVHKITLVYRPQAFTWGLATSGLSFLLWLTLILIERLAKRYGAANFPA